MTYWGPIRCATLKNLSDAELAIGGLACDRAVKRGFGKMAGGLGAGVVAAFAAPFLAPVVTLAIFIAAPVMLYAGYRQVRQNLDGMKAHSYEEARRVLLSMSPPQPAPQPAVEPAPAPAPVFNGQAAVVLDSDITPMKRIQINAKSAPAAR